MADCVRSKVYQASGRNLKTVEGWKRRGYALESKNGRLASKKTRKKEKFPDIEQEFLRFFQRYRSEGYLSKILLNGPGFGSLLIPRLEWMAGEV